MASDSVAKQTTKLLGNVLVKMNLFPIALAEGEKITAKIEELKHTIKFQSKKASCLGTAIGNIETGEDNLRQNLTMGINFLVSLMKKGWQNVGTLHIKTSMGRSYRIFGWLYTSFKSNTLLIKDYFIIGKKYTFELTTTNKDILFFELS